MILLVLPLSFVLLFSGCKEKEKIDYGPETSAESIQEALGKAFSEYDPNKMKVGEWAQLDQTQLLNNELYLISDMAQNIVMRDEDEVEATFRAVENRRFFDRDLKVTKKVDTEFSIKWKFETEPATVSQKTASDLFGDPIYRLNQDIVQMQAAGADGTMTYHNLQTSMALETPPGDVGTSPDCHLHFPDCKVRVYTIKFDMIFWEGGKGDKLIREYKLSPDVPYLGAVLSECLTGLVPVENSRIFVKECTQTKNFRFGTGQTSSQTPTP